MIDIDTLRRIVSYDPINGKLTWGRASPDMFSAGKRHSAETRCAIWNSKYPGMPALAYMDKTRPYPYGDIFGEKYYAHRVAFAIMMGRWPEMIDHIDGDKTNNRWGNLREVTVSENGMNCRRRSDNKSGATGVYFDKSRGQWAVEIAAHGKKKFVGRFRLYKDAISARKIAQLEMGFSDRHGL